jgi:subtilisin family serine protease
MKGKIIFYIVVMALVFFPVYQSSGLDTLTGEKELQAKGSCKENIRLFNEGKPYQRVDGLQYVKDQLLVKTKTEISEFHGPGKTLGPRTPESLIQSKYRSRIENMERARFADCFIIKTTEQCDIESFKEQLIRDPLVVDVSFNYIASITATDQFKTPNDMFFDYQWALKNTGQNYFNDVDEIQGVTGSDIHATRGWYWSTGAENVIIAVIDTGVASDHEDLISKVLPGYNFVSDNTDTYDDHGHGTLVASVAAADTNNTIGVAGVSWASKILPVKVMDEQGYGDYLAVAAGIRYAADQGASVINLSMGGEYNSFILEDACRYAFQRGCVIVASAGNDGIGVFYPAAYDSYCLAVAATDDRDDWVSWSNFGPEVDVAAPGVLILGASYHPEEPNPADRLWYSYGSGTSYSAPLVAGAAALVISYKPFLTNLEVMNLIKYTADDVNSSIYPGIDDLIGYGRLNLKTLLAPFLVED